MALALLSLRAAGVRSLAGLSVRAQAAASAGLAPFHLAFPVNDLDKSREFYGGVLGCQEGRSSSKWIDYSLYARSLVGRRSLDASCREGHQLVCHYVGPKYSGMDFFNPVGIR